MAKNKNLDQEIEQTLKDLNQEVSQSAPEQAPDPQGRSRTLYSYTAKEFERYERSVTWYIIFTAIGLLLITYSVISRSPMMFIVFTLMFILTLIISNREPREIQIDITTAGIVLDRSKFFRYQDMEAFGVFIDPPVSFLSLYLTEGLVQYTRIPLGTENPEDIALLVEQYVPREDGRERLVDRLDHILKI